MDAGRRGGRLMLLEFLHPNPCRRYHSDQFPFLQGFARGLDVETRWFYVLAGPDWRPENEFVIEPPPEARAAVLEAVCAVSPTVLVTNETCGPALLCAMRQVQGLRRLVSIAADVPRYSPITVGHVRDWLGFPQEGPLLPDALLLDHAAPDYSCAPLKPEERCVFPRLKVIGGPPCLYRRPLRANPWFRDLDLGGANRLGGCSFCLGDAVGNPWARQVSSPVSLALLQIARFRETAPLERQTDRYHFAAYGVFQRMEDFFPRILKMDLPPSEFHFSCRLDDFLGRATVIERLLPDLRQRAHSLHISNISVENFSPDENARFNKGLDAATVERALHRLHDLEARWPKTFVFSGEGGVSFILFTPWTTLDDLTLNAREMRRLGVAPVFLRSRLQLRPGTPITLLAIRDGLTAHEFAQPSPLDYPCHRYPDEEEVPWRFRHPEVAVAYRVMLRIGPDSRIPTDDPLRRALSRLVVNLDPITRDPYLILEALVEVLRAGVRSDEEVCPALERALLRRAPDRIPAMVLFGRRLDRLLEPVKVGGPRTLAGYQVEAVERETSEADGTRLRLVAGSDRVVFSVYPDDPSRPAAVRGGGFRLVYPPSLALDTPARQRLLKTLERLLYRYGPHLA